jgi:hypothetical protein
VRRLPPVEAPPADVVDRTDALDPGAFAEGVDPLDFARAAPDLPPDELARRRSLARLRGEVREDSAEEDPGLPPDERARRAALRRLRPG